MSLKYYIKRLFFRKDRFEKVHVSDVVWAKRYKNKKQERQIPEGHKNGPYIVIHKKRNKLYCLKCTSVEPPKHCENLYYSLGKIRLGFEKETFAKLSELEIIRPKRYLNYMSRINEEDFNNINKEMYLLKKQNPKFNIKKRYCKFRIGVGDIICYKGKMYNVFGVDKKYYLANPLYQINKKTMHTVIIDGKPYSLEKDNTVKIRKWTKIELIDVRG